MIDLYPATLSIDGVYFMIIQDIVIVLGRDENLAEQIPYFKVEGRKLDFTLDEKTYVSRK